MVSYFGLVGNRFLMHFQNCSGLVSFHEVSGIETSVKLQRKAEKNIESAEEEKLRIIQTVNKR